MSATKKAVPKTKVSTKEIKTYPLILTVKERLIMGALFPQRGSMLSMGIMEQLRGRVKFSPSEMEAIGLEEIKDSNGSPTGNLRWKDDLAEAFGNTRYKLTESEVGFLQERVNDMDKKNEISEEIYPLCRKIANLKVAEDESA